MNEKHNGLPVQGCRPQPQEAIDVVNASKVCEEQILRALDELALPPSVDKRWLAIGRTAIEQGFMAVNRAVFRPGRISLPGDPSPSA